MRKLFIFAFLANVALNLVSYMLFPATVAIHFGRGGIANSWAPKELNAIIFLAADLLIFFISFVVPPSVFKFPSSMINLPHKDYWLSEKNKPQATKIFSTLMAEFGIALFALLFLVGLLVLEANFSEPVRLDDRLMWFALIAFLLYTAYWCVKLFRSFRIPPNAPTR